jgi:Helix-turn-helix of DDE superfamily endonuclease
VSDALIQRWKTRGRKPALDTHDAFFMTLLYLRNYSSFSELGKSFGLKDNTAKDTIQRVLTTIRDPLFTALVRPLSKSAQIAEGKNIFNVQELLSRLFLTWRLL